MTKPSEKMLSRYLSFLLLALAVADEIVSAESNEIKEVCQNYDSTDSSEGECIDQSSTSDGALKEENADEEDWDDQPDTEDEFAREYWTTEDLNQNKTIHNLWWNLKCAKIFVDVRPIPTKEQFNTAIDLYHSIVNDESLHFDTTEPGIHVEIEVKQVEGKGRGIFAVKDIPKGQPWRNSYDYTAIFYDGEDYIKFVLGLETGLACDVLQWAYAEYDPETDNPSVGVDLDKATICNNGGKEDHNVGCDLDNPDMKCEDFEYAVHDIKVRPLQN